MIAKVEAACRLSGRLCEYADPNTGVTGCGRIEGGKVVACELILADAYRRDNQNLGPYIPKLNVINPEVTDKGGVTITSPRRVDEYTQNGILVNSIIRRNV